jgi:hypothetical protein
MTLEERLENMERKLGQVKRRQRGLLGAVLLVAGGLIIPLVFETTASRARGQGAGTAKEMRARKIIIEDENGNARAQLFAGIDGPMLILWDENGMIRAGLTAAKDGTMLALYDENGKFGAGLKMAKGGSSLWLGDEKGETRVNMNATKEGPGLVLYDENGMIRAGLRTAKNGPTLALLDENGKPRFVAGRAETGTPDGKTIAYPESSLVLFGPDGRAIWSAIK